MKLFFIFFCTVLFSLPTAPIFAQSYIACLGVRLGTDIGITGKYLVSPELHLTAEGILQQNARTGDAAISLLAEQHKSLLTRRFNFYYGGGLHYFWLKDKPANISNPVGVSVIAGAEFTIGRLNISWDFKPAIHLAGGKNSYEIQSGLSLRYVFEKRRWRIDWEDFKFWKKKK